MAKRRAKATKDAATEGKRKYLKQSDVPSASPDEALRIPEAIFDHYAGEPTAPLYVAKALNVDPNGSQLKVLSGAAIAFGVSEGGAQAAMISVTDLARKILRPTEEGADYKARREAVLRPRVFGEFLRKYDSHPFPREDIAQNILENMGVPRSRTLEVLGRIESSAVSVGMIEEIKDKKYISLAGTGTPQQADSMLTATENSAEQESVSEERPVDYHLNAPLQTPRDTPKIQTTALANAIKGDERRRHVFITHGKNRAFVEPIRNLLEYGEMEPVVSVEKQSVSKPVPEKVMDDMRGCGAAIIHVDADQKIDDHEGKAHVFLNPNVLIEIGAAMAFYGRRFILLVRDGVKLPSNLQGLYEVRYSGDTLDSDATIRLLDAIKDIKNYGLPSDPPEDDD